MLVATTCFVVVVSAISNGCWQTVQLSFAGALHTYEETRPGLAVAARAIVSPHSAIASGGVAETLKAKLVRTAMLFA